MNLSDFATLADAKKHTEVKGRMVSADMVVSFLTETDSVIILKDSASTNPKAAGFLLALNGAVTEYNIITGNTVGDKQQLLLTYLVFIGAVTQSFKDAVISYANPIIYPFISATEHEFQISKGAVKLKPITQVGGYAVIHTNAVCENHNPRLIAKAVNPRTNKTTYQRINNFYNVSEASSYDCKVPSEYLGNELFVDDVYSVII